MVVALCKYTCLKKRCRLKRENDGQCDTVDISEDGTDKFVTGFRFFIFKIFSFQDNLNYKLRVRFFGKIQIRILASKNGFCVSLPKSENGLITD